VFTGIITDCAPIKIIETLEGGSKRLVIDTRFADCELGESIAVNGVCLTISKKEKHEIEFLVSPETLKKSNLGNIPAFGEKVNLERALLAHQRLSGHWVQGHVDCTGVVRKIQKVGECFNVHIEIPEEYIHYVVDKGSIAINGISLTVNSIENCSISLMIIPHTWENTNLSQTRPGLNVNIEVDILAKYVEKMRFRGTQ
jgi:riboflavin synthase